MKKHLLLASLLISLGSATIYANATNLPSDTLKLYNENIRMGALLIVTYETEDLTAIEALRKELDNQALTYTMEYTFTISSEKATTKKWKLESKHKADSQDSRVDQQVTSLQDVIRSKNGRFSWTITSPPN